MKFSASSAVLAVLVAKAAVSAAPMPVHGESDIEARAEFVEVALDGVWERFYDELLDEVDARDYEEDLDARDFDDEDLFERSPMKKFATDLATGLAQKAPTYAKQYSQSEQAKHRTPAPRMANVVQQAMAANKGSSARPPVRPLPADSKWNTLKKPGVLDQVRALGKPSIASQAKGAFGKKRSLDDNEESLFERAPMKKFATDLATGLAQKAPTYAKQYTQSEEAKRRNAATPRMASVVQQAMAANKAPAAKPPAFPKIPASSKWNTVKKPSVMEEIKKLGKK